MAKRRKEKDEEEDKPFKIPKFDEKAFLKRERRNIKTSFISFLFGGFMALICFGFWLLMGNDVPLRWELVFLVGIVNADIILNIPDFKAAERTFALITQVAGRAGREGKKGHHRPSIQPQLGC